MRIVIDLQGAQTESRFRGIGRYTMAFARGVVENCGDHEVILALSGLFPDTIEPIRSAFEDLLPKKNIRVWYAPQRVQESIPGNEKRREVAELVRESFLASLQPDVVHLTSLFEGFVDDAVTSVGRLDSKIPVSIALYDLIPLLNPEQYLKPSPRYSDFYARKVEYLQKADLCLAISKFAQQECGTALESLKGKTVNVSTAITGSFEPKALNPSTERALREKFGIKGSFVLYSGGSDERKNLTRLITAYAALPSELRQSHQLVFAGRMPQGDVDRFKREARSEGLTQEELCFTGYISDDELVHLYSLCELYVFPSWHEGFGLPALEAMACGAPVIGANTSSVPEVIGLEEALFDPFDVSSIQAKMKQALIDPSFRARLKAHGEKRAEIFSWEETAQRAITAWEELVIEEKQNEDQIFSNSWAAVSKSLNGNYSNLISSLGLSMSAGSTLDDQDMKLLAKCIDLNEREVFSFFRCRELPEKINWRIEGPFDSSYSLALVNRETARGLSSLGHEVSLHSTEGPGDFDPDVKFLGENPDLNEMYRRVNTTPDSDADVVSRNLYPPRVLDMPGRLNLLHGYAWEESGFPAKWVEDFNQALQGILVTSSHVKKVLIDNGVAVPIAVTGNGVDHWNRITPQKTKRVSDRRFKFLHVSSCFPRKGADRMLEAYGRAFSSRDDVTLVIKTFENPHNDIHRWLEEARSKSRDFPDVVVLEGDFTDAELKGLYEQCDSLVAPSRAEGFGLPMAEAMLSGLAVITTNWSGQVDFCTPDTAWLVDYQFERAKSHFNLFSSVWADPDVGHLASAMRDVFEATDFERQKRINAGRKLLAADYSWARVAEKMTQAASEWSASLDPVEPSIGWVTTWNTRCGIATYSKHLLENMPSHATIFAPYSQELIEQDTKNVNRCWEDGDRDALVELGNAVNGAKVDTLVVQFNYGFFGFEAFSDFLNKQVDAGRKVVVMMHATNDPAHAPGKKLETLVGALKRCHRLLVHSPYDMNRLKSLSLIHNVTLFPHGMLERGVAETGLRSRNDRFLVGSYGFFLPHKGLLELIDAVAMLIKEGLPIELRMFNSEYPVNESRLLIDSANKKVSQLGLEKRVSINTSFLDDEVCVANLSELDLIVFPYQDTGESASGAVRYAFASKTPVAITPLPIFDDVSEAAFKLPGQTTRDIAEGIKEIYYKFQNKSPEVEKIAEMAEEWRSQHSYPRISQRLYGMLKALANQVSE